MSVGCRWRVQKLHQARCVELSPYDVNTRRPNSIDVLDALEVHKHVAIGMLGEG